MTKPLKQIKVTHVASGDRWAGAEAQVYTLLKTLNKMADVTVYAVILNDGELAKKLGDEGINTTILDETHLSSWKILGRLKSLFQEIQPDIIHTHRLKENVLATIANKLSTNASLVATIHGDSEFNYPIWKIHKHAPQWINWLCTRFLYKKLIAVSTDLGEKLSNSYPKKYIQVIENGIDIEAVQLAADSSHFETDPAIKRHVAIAGRLEKVKRVDIFLDTAKLLINSSPENTWHFYIFGEGSLESILKKRAQENEIEKNVTFHGQRNDIASCLKAMNCLVMCSDHEGLPMTPLESIAVGTPVIAHRTGGLVNIIENQCGGLLVSNHSPKGYSEAVSKLFDNDQQLKNIENNGLDRIGQKFAAKTNSELIIASYQNLRKIENTLIQTMPDETG
jgi:glycosyltransferase involved in cell wall biosynthesis